MDYKYTVIIINIMKILHIIHLTTIFSYVMKNHKTPKYVVHVKNGNRLFKQMVQTCSLFKYFLDPRPNDNV